MVGLCDHLHCGLWRSLSSDLWRKVLAVIIIVCGVGIFGMISGVITSILTAPTKQQDHRSKNKERMLEQLLEQQEQILERLTLIEEEMQQRKIQTKIGPIGPISL